MHAARALQGAVVCFGSLQAVAIEVASFLTRNGLPFLVKGKMSSSMARERPALCAGDPSRISENSNEKRNGRPYPNAVRRLRRTRQRSHFVRSQTRPSFAAQKVRRVKNPCNRSKRRPALSRGRFLADFNFRVPLKRIWRKTSNQTRPKYFGEASHFLGFKNAISLVKEKKLVKATQ